MTKWRLFREIAAALIQLIAVYAPAFALAAWLHPPVPLVVPMIIVMSAAIAALLIYWQRDPRLGMAEFGLRSAPLSTVILALALGTLGGTGVAYVSALIPAKSPIDLSALSPWMVGLYFIVGAPVQEELIFRGLLQSMLARATSGLFRGSQCFPVAFVALLFAIVHLGSGRVVVGGALLLGLAAGELRRRSGSLFPAVIVHALFNTASAVWPAR